MAWYAEGLGHSQEFVQRKGLSGLMVLEVSVCGCLFPLPFRNGGETEGMEGSHSREICHVTAERGKVKRGGGRNGGRHRQTHTERQKERERL